MKIALFDNIVVTSLLAASLMGTALAQGASPIAKPAPTADGKAKSADEKAKTAAGKESKQSFLPKIGGLSPGTPSPWGIPPELRIKGSRQVEWFLQNVATEASMSFSPVAESRGVAYAMTVPLRSDRQFLGTRIVTPIGGDTRDGITSNSFKLARGGAATTDLLYGFAFPLSDAETLTVDGNVYARGGNDVLARSWGATLPYGAYVDHSTDTAYAIPGFSPTFNRLTYHREGPKHRLRAVVGDYNPIMWSPVEGERERNYIDLNNLMFRPFIANTSILAFGTVYPPDRQFGPVRPAVRGGDVYLRSGDFEGEVLSARTETHPSEPFSGWRYRQALGGRVGVRKPTWGLGASFWNMYGDNLAVPADPTLGNVPAGDETLWALDGSSRVLGDLSAFGAYAQTGFSRNGNAFNDHNDAVILGLIQKGWPGKNGEIKLHYQSIGANYEGLSVRNQLFCPANYRVWSGDIRYPFKGGVLTFSLRQSEQLQPDIAARGAVFANNDIFFPSNAHNKAKGNILDWLGGLEFEIPKTPCRIYLSNEYVTFHRGLTPSLNFSATSRTVGQQMAVVRFKASEQLSVDVGVMHFQTGGTLGSFTRDIIFDEKQTVPRIGISYTPQADISAYLLLQKFQHTDGVVFSNGLNNYNASTVLLEVQSRWGGRL